MTLAFWVCSSITVISAAVSFGYAFVGLRAATGDVRTPSMYAFARSLALLVVAIIVPFTGSVAFATAIAIAMIIVQSADAVIGVRLHDKVKTFGPAATALIGLAAVVWLLLA
jgi:hypothetical protein